MQLSHVSGLHLLFNCSALWNMGSVEAGGLHAAGSGSIFYLSYTLLFLVLSAAVSLISLAQLRLLFLFGS